MKKIMLIMLLLASFAFAAEVDEHAEEVVEVSHTEVVDADGHSDDAVVESHSEVDDHGDVAGDGHGGGHGDESKLPYLILAIAAAVGGRYYLKSKSRKK